MPTLTRDGVDIHFEVHGAGPALLLTHGYSATSEMWSGQIEALAADHTLITWDMRGHGQSDSPTDADQYSAALTVADMAALLDHVNAPSAIVGGLSLGGYMSLAFYGAHPERVRALLIIDTGPGFKNDEARAGWNTYANSFADGFAESGLDHLADRSVEQATASHRDPNGLVLAARHMLTQHSADVIESLPSIGVPSLVLVGADDEPFLNATDYMAAKIPGATKVVIPDAGHASNIDQPAAFNAAVLDFLAAHDL
ncbi:alpha/beta fold hydrolase [Ilumatobacter nonamiensis]|uniref:alpha/beta fold hydrolase n=1 Tax=Ilumatobacter nonamiensis TaxID=467093 RepID=UPI00034A664E|nr:alpha/beta fold hydrolase [Ilumatobacter nonamiensis]